MIDSNMGGIDWLLLPQTVDRYVCQYIEDEVEFARSLNELRTRARISGLVKIKEIDSWAKMIVREARKKKKDFKPSGDKAAVGLDLSDITFRIGDQVEISDKMLSFLEADGPIVFDLQQFWKGDDASKIWKPLHDAFIEATCTRFSGCPVVVGEDKTRPLNISAGAIAGAISIMRAKRNEAAQAGGQSGFFDVAPAGITFNNGFLKLDARNRNAEIVEPLLTNRSTVGFGFNFDPYNMPPAPRFEEYLESVFLGDSDKEEKKKMFLEVLGAGLCGLGDAYQKATVLYDNTANSQGANGKSVGLKILSEILPSWSVSSISPVSFEERFARVGLVGRRVNLITEMPEDGDFISGEHTKAIISGDPIQAEFKGKDIFFFRPRAIHVVACNRFPKVRDTSDAFWRRWQVLTFNNTFLGNDAIRNIERDIIDNELEGVVCRLVMAAIELVLRGSYTEPASSIQALNMWRTDCNPVLLFLNERCLNVKDGVVQDSQGNQSMEIAASDLYAAYVEYCRASGFKAVSVTRFGRDVGVVLKKTRRSNGWYYNTQVEDSDSGFNVTPFKKSFGM
jgi:P4 family phage/plasmid primase-like protien